MRIGKKIRKPTAKATAAARPRGRQIRERIHESSRRDDAGHRDCRVERDHSNGGRGVSTLPVSESDHLVGIVTAREIAIRIAAEALDPTRAPVRQAMSSDVLYCFENEDIEDVSQKMGAWWVRRLPVVDREKRLVGMISLAHIAARTAASNPRETANELHTPIHNRRACPPS